MSPLMYVHNTCLNLELHSVLSVNWWVWFALDRHQLSIQDTVLCLDYPPHNYTLMVEDPEGNMTDPIAQTSLATGSVIRIVINDLMGDTYYLYYVVGTYQFGSSRSSSVGICKSIIISLYN